MANSADYNGSISSKMANGHAKKPSSDVRSTGGAVRSAWSARTPC